MSSFGRDADVIALHDKRKEKKAMPQGAALTLDQWLARDTPSPDFLLGSLLATTSRMMLVGPTGLGKTMFGLAVATAIASGEGFLHWEGHRTARVLYIDGEMSRRTMKVRLRDAVRQIGQKPDGLIVLSKEDFEDMPPLNADAGQKWLNDFIESQGPFDLIVFDNIQALLVGDMKDEEQWSKVLPWVRDLTRRSIGQLWLHHTGHDETKSYGSKAREWQLDTVALMERVEAPNADLAFMIKFTKARERTPDTRREYQDVTMSLTDGKWDHTAEAVRTRPLGPNMRLMLKILREAMPSGLAVEEWSRKAAEAGIAIKQRRSEARMDLKERKLVYEFNDRWFVSGPCGHGGPVP